MTDVPDESQQADEAASLAAYDLDGDGRISAVEDLRAELGVIDARMAELSKEHGVKGKLADAAHHVLDKLDNDG